MAKLQASGHFLSQPQKGPGAPELDRDIHSEQARAFMRDIIQANSWVGRILDEGYVPNFTSEPGRYMEANNKSALENIDFLRDKVAKWENQGYVQRLTEPAHCTNPLTVAEKYDLNTDTVKLRPVLDLSRHVNLLVEDRPVQLDDLARIEHLLEPGDYMTAFDLKNMFFHVKLHPSVWKYFGFAVPDEQGTMKFYQFTVMVYGLKSAVHVVTRLILPLKAFIHQLNIRFTIYVDDGRCLGKRKLETQWKQWLVLNIFQLAGWSIQWDKTTKVPTQQLNYQGFVTNSVSMSYYVAPEKIIMTQQIVRLILSTTETGEMVTAKLLALALGKIISMTRSHGSVLQVLSRSAQHDLGVAVHARGWEGQLVLSATSIHELSLLITALDTFNGQNIMYINEAYVMNNNVNDANFCTCIRLVRKEDGTSQAAVMC